MGAGSGAERTASRPARRRSAGLPVAVAIFCTTQASPDSTTPATINTGTKTYDRSAGSSSQRKRVSSRAAADSRSRVSTSSVRASSSRCRRSVSRSRSSIRFSRPSVTRPNSITSTTSSNTPQIIARCHCHRYR